MELCSLENLTLFKQKNDTIYLTKNQALTLFQLLEQSLPALDFIEPLQTLVEEVYILFSAT